jgi:hypothetical protein
VIGTINFVDKNLEENMSLNLHKLHDILQEKPSSPTKEHYLILEDCARDLLVNPEKFINSVNDKNFIKRIDMLNRIISISNRKLSVLIGIMHELSADKESFFEIKEIFSDQMQNKFENYIFNKRMQEEVEHG